MAWERFVDKGKKPSGYKRTKVDYENFVKRYMESYRLGHNTRESAESMGVPLGIWHSRANYLRGRGVNLPKLTRPRYGSSLDIESLKKIMEENDIPY